ncbi:MFS transporter [Nocardia salmonicida]|uniref:MFS transporter n=1 Tax=Nocardia salmonicida TaxID=53431 RepID=UPI003631B3FB
MTAIHEDAARPVRTDLSASSPGGPTNLDAGSTRRKYAPHQRRHLLMVLTASTAMMAGASAPTPFYPRIQADLGFTPFVTTCVFAVYAATLLATVLATGSLAGHLNRRPVISTGFLILSIGIMLFSHADTAAELIAARSVQGVATGLLLSALPALVVDIGSARPSGSATASTWNSITTMGGLAVGAFSAAIVLDRTEDSAPTIVFTVFTALYLLAAVAIWTVPETAAHHPRIQKSLRPRITLPPGVSAPYLRGAPAVVAGWATGGLYLSLGPAIVVSHFRTGSHAVASLGLVLLASSGAVACFVLRHRTPRFASIFGTSALSVGTIWALIALTRDSEWMYFSAVIVAGTGYGTAFSGVLRSITPLTRPADRAGVLAAVYALSYTAFGLPVVISGLLIPRLGLNVVTYWYGGIVAGLSILAAILRWRAPIPTPG